MKTVQTSETDPIIVDFIPADHYPFTGKIGLTIAPGRNDEEAKTIQKRHLLTDLNRLKDLYKVDRLVCLLADKELEYLLIPTLLTDAESLGIKTHQLAIVDDELPQSRDDFHKLVRKINEAAAAGETVIIHCRGGRGRTGTMAAACLIEAGLTADKAIGAVQSVRTGALSNDSQKEFVLRFASKL